MEQKMDLGGHRLGVSMALGNEFAQLLEQEGPIEISDTSTLHRVEERLRSLKNGKHFIEQVEGSESRNLIAKALRDTGFGPNLILGINISGFSSLTTDSAILSLDQQTGLPPGAGPGPIKDVISGRDFCIVVLGLNNLSSSERNKLTGHLKKFSSVAGVLISTE